MCVHRDLKPDNIMVGADGRVRVMDFGLARSLSGLHEAIAITHPGVDAPRPGPQPYTGAFLGTPGYAAPEQQLGVSADARSDVFSFCVLAFEALHGTRPFVARTDGELLVAVVAGKFAPVAPGVVPAWLDAVIRRGLADQPDLRWPTMTALLAALVDDPIARRRRRLRAAARVAAIGLLVAAVMLTIAAIRSAAERARHEDSAAERLRGALAAYARAEADGDTASAEAAFRAFVSDPAHARTAALTRAWLAHGDRRLADPPAARADYAEAYVHATSVADERAALHRLAAAFTRDRDAVGLARSVALLRARGADDADLADLAFDAALWQRDLPAAVAELARPDHPHADWRPLLAHLATARAATRFADRVAVLPPGGPARVAVREGEGARVALLDAALRDVGAWHPDGRVDLLPATGWALDQTARETRVVDLATGAVLGRAAPYFSVFAPFDATRDGAPELFLGRTWPQYGFLRWDGLGGPGAALRDAHPGTDASGSTFEAHAVGDLDGDGRDELVIGFGPWHRFDLRVYRTDDRGELELVAQRLLGRIGGAAIIRRGARPQLAVFVDDSSPAPELFPDPPHTGGPPGVHFYSLVRGDLALQQLIAMPADVKAVDRKAVGDLDGDGREDLALAFERHGPWLLLLRQTDAGFDPLQLAGLELWAGAELDDDAPLELIATSPDRDSVLALGAGETPTPPAGTPLPAGAPLPPDLADDPWLVARWTRASDLVSLALAGSAAESLRDAALLTVDRRARSALLDRAGELFASQDRHADVLALDPDVHDDPDVQRRAGLRRAEALSRLGRHHDALAEAQGLLTGPAEPRVRALVDDLTALLDPDARLDLDLTAPLADAWQLHTPGAVRRDAARSVLTLAVPAVEAPVAELAIDWRGGPVSLEFEVAVQRLEFGACVEVSLADATGRRWLGGALCGHGGGGLLNHAVWVNTSTWTTLFEHPVPAAAQTVRMHLTYFPGHAATVIVLTDGARTQLGRLTVAAPPAPGRHRLLLASFLDSRESSLALADLRRLTLRGARPPADLPAADRAAGLFAEHEPRAALAALEPGPLAGHEPLAAREPGAQHPRAAVLRVLARAELGDLAGLGRAVQDLLPHLDDPAWQGSLALLIRRHPLAAAALRAAAGPALLPVLARTWNFAGAHRNDPKIFAEVFAGLLGVDALVPRDAAEREALRQLLAIRAEMWRRTGKPDHARRDHDAAAALARETPSRGE
mgnify:CR=1 FL=1